MTQVAWGLLLCGVSVGIVTFLIAKTDARHALIWSRTSLPASFRYAATSAGILAVMAIWLIGHALNSDGPTRIPSPWETIRATVALFDNGGWWDVLASAARVVVGFSAAAILSILLAFLFALHSVTTSAFSPPIRFIRYIPPTAFTVLLVIYFGIDELYKTAVIFVGVFFFNFHMTLDIIEDFDVRYVELARLTGASFKRRHSVLWLFRTTVIPSSAPRLWDMMRTNLSFAWTFLVVAELVGAEYGLGKQLYLAQRFFRVDQVYACILLFGLIGGSSDFLMGSAKRVLFRWHDDATRS